jgi:hypothetical protein
MKIDGAVGRESGAVWNEDVRETYATAKEEPVLAAATVRPVAVQMFVLSVPCRQVNLHPALHKRKKMR